MAIGLTELVALLVGGAAVLLARWLRDRMRTSDGHGTTESTETGTDVDPENGSDPDDGTTQSTRPSSAPYEVSAFDTPRVEVTIAQSRALHSGRGDVPAQVVARHLHGALDRGGIDHRVDVHDAPVVPPAEGTVGSGTPVWWRDNGAEAITPASHANLLLVDAAGGGGTYGSWCVVGTGGIDENVATRASRTDGIGAGVFAALHECGHALGLAHDLDADTADKQHTGEGWNEDGRWHLTPMNVDHGVANACGVDIPTRERDAVTYHLTYTDCTIEHIVDGLGGEET